MQVLTTDSAIEPDVKQGENPVGTGYVPAEVIDLLEKVASGWDEKLAFQAFRAVLYLHRKHPNRDGFTTLEVGEALREISGKRWTQDLTDTDEVGRKIRKYWLGLQAIWPSKAKGVEEHLSAAGLAGQVAPDKHESAGGAGRPSRYFVRYRADPLGVEDSKPAAVPLSEGEIQYFTDDLIEAGWRLRWFSNGYRLSGWRRQVFIWYFIAHVMAVLALFFLLLAFFFLPGIPADPKIFVAIPALIAAICYSAWPMFDLIERRIIVAPGWLQSHPNDVVLEVRCPPRHDHKHLQAVRYTARCGICSGRVHIQSGGFRFWGRLVGVCDGSPREHVYSFDHITRLGARL